MNQRISRVVAGPLRADAMRPASAVIARFGRAYWRRTAARSGTFDIVGVKVQIVLAALARLCSVAPQARPSPSLSTFGLFPDLVGR
jgi:hypothetical protein